MRKLYDAPAFRAGMPSTAEAMKMSEASVPALMALILIVFALYIVGVGLHALGLFKLISVEGIGQFDAALAFLLVVAMTIRGAVLHGLLSFCALSTELQRAEALRVEEIRVAKETAVREVREQLRATLNHPSAS